VRGVSEFTAPGSDAQRSLVSDVFHELSQPLTALQCSLELSLLRDQTSEEFRSSVEAALQNADRLRQSLLLLRELSDANDPGDTSVPVELQRLLKDLQEDFLPVFESVGGPFDVACDPVQVRGNAAKLNRAFFYLIDHLLRGTAGASLSVCVEQTNRRWVEINMTFSGTGSTGVSEDDLSESASAGGVDIARRTFRALGGDLAFVESNGGPGVWIASLPLAE
jgi:signal transduction histidine kinase